MPKLIQPDMEASWRPLVWHAKASAAGVAGAHCVIFAATQIIGRDHDIMNDLVYAFGKLAGTVDEKTLLKTPQKIVQFQDFVFTNWPNA